AGWAGWLRALTRRNLHSAGTLPDWTEVEEVLSRADTEGVDRVEIVLARAEILVQRGKLDQAEKLLQTEVRRPRESPALKVALADVLALRGRFGDSLSLLGKQDDREARLARLRYVQHGGNKLPDAAAVLTEATRNLDRLAPAEVAAILQVLAESARSRGDLK